MICSITSKGFTKPPAAKISHKPSILFFSSPVIISINLPVPSVRGIAAAADLDDLTALGEVIQRTLDGGLADIRALRHDLCLCDFAKVVMDDVTDTVGFAGVLTDDFHTVGEFPVGCQNDTQLIGHKRNIVIFTVIICIFFSISCVVAGDINDTEMATYETQMVGDANDELINSLSKMGHIRPEEFPNIDLYMDQVTTFMDKRLKNTTRNPEEDKILTKTMINNYAKNNKILRKKIPVKESFFYRRTHDKRTFLFFDRWRL